MPAWSKVRDRPVHPTCVNVWRASATASGIEHLVHLFRGSGRLPAFLIVDKRCTTIRACHGATHHAPQELWNRCAIGLEPLFGSPSATVSIHVAEILHEDEHFVFTVFIDGLQPGLTDKPSPTGHLDEWYRGADVWRRAIGIWMWAQGRDPFNVGDRSPSESDRLICEHSTDPDDENSSQYATEVSRNHRSCSKRKTRKCRTATAHPWPTTSGVRRPSQSKSWGPRTCCSLARVRRPRAALNRTSIGRTSRSHHPSASPSNRRDHCSRCSCRGL